MRQLDEYLVSSSRSEKAEKALGCVVPHAGYMYSGRVAGAVYSELSARSSYILLGPNHTGRGAPLAMMGSGEWLTPLGAVLIDAELARTVRHHCHLVTEDAAAHEHEHSLEVQLPFLQITTGNLTYDPASTASTSVDLWRRAVGTFSFVPIVIGVGGYAALEALGHGLAQAVKGATSAPLLIASSDMNHYEPDDVTRVKDGKAIEKILALDPQGLYEVVRREDISMCGYGPTVAMLTAARDLGGREARLVKYATSADARGERSAVVGYAGIIVS